jgi:sulfite reductase (NADPH) hemoprotein beta-component
VRKIKTQRAFDELVNAMDGPPLLILYASDGGTAEKVAKRLAAREKVRGIATRVQTFDSFPLAHLTQESHVAFVTSTAGQGEPPQNGRDTFKALNAVAARRETPLQSIKYAVFGMGDSHYWLRPEDKQLAHARAIYTVARLRVPSHALAWSLGFQGGFYAKCLPM